MKKILFLLFAAMQYTSGVTAQNVFELRGQADTSFNNQYLYIYGIDWSGMNPNIRDSALVTGGRFLFRGKLNTPGLLVSLYIRKSISSFTQIYIRNSKMTVQLKGKEWNKKENVVVRHSPENDDYRHLQSSMGNLESSLGKLRYMMDSIQRKHPDTTLSAMEADAMALRNRIAASRKEWVTRHPAAYISLVVLSYFEFEKLAVPELQALYSGLRPELQRLPEGILLRERIERRAAIQVGKTAPDFAIKDTTGNIFRLSDARGQYVLLDFWASWCQPCLAQVPELKRFYEENRGRDLKVIGISLDSDSTRWLAAIRTHGLNWQHGSDLKGWKGTTGLLYNIEAIPQNVLVGPDGRIIALNIDLRKYAW